MVGDYSGRNNNTFIEGLADYVAVIEVGGDFRTLSIACTTWQKYKHMQVRYASLLKCLDRATMWEIAVGCGNRIFRYALRGM